MSNVMVSFDMAGTLLEGWLALAIYGVISLIVLYLYRINQLLSGTPAEIRKLTGPPWTEQELKKTYERLDREPIDYKNELPPRQDRRYVVTGGNGGPIASNSQDTTDHRDRACWRVHRLTIDLARTTSE